MEKKNFVGIDISKNTFDAALNSGEHSKFENNENGFESFLSWVCGTLSKDLEECLFTLENTGNYSVPLANYLYKKGCMVWVENPLQIKRSIGLVRGKDDKTDARQIARYAERNVADMRPYEPLSENVSELRKLLSNRALLVNTRTSLINSRKENNVAATGSKTDSFLEEIYLKTIDKITNDIKEIERRMDDIIGKDERISSNFKHIVSIKGMGKINAFALLIITNNFSWFGLDARKLACHAGVAPFKNESGTSVRKGTHVSRLSNRQLKPLLTQAAMSAIRFNEQLRDYYNRLILRGKPFQVALNNVKNKLLHIVMGLIRTDSDYDPTFHLQRSSDFKSKSNLLSDYDPTFHLQL